MDSQISDRRLGEDLLRHGLVTESQLKTAQEYHDSLGGRFQDALLKLGFLTHEQLDNFPSSLDSGLHVAEVEAVEVSTSEVDASPTEEVDAEVLLQQVSDPLVAALARALLDQGLFTVEEWRSQL